MEYKNVFFSFEQIRVVQGSYIINDIFIGTTVFQFYFMKLPILHIIHINSTFCSTLNAMFTFPEKFPFTARRVFHIYCYEPMKLKACRAGIAEGGGGGGVRGDLFLFRVPMVLVGNLR